MLLSWHACTVAEVQIGQVDLLCGCFQVVLLEVFPQIEQFLHVNYEELNVPLGKSCLVVEEM